MTIIQEIKTRIDSMENGTILMTSDFSDIASITTVRQCLGRCAEDGMIRRVFDGVYEKPKYSDLLGEYLPADPERVAYALAGKYRWSITPCGDIALNKLGLTAQVPAVWSYVSDGPYRTYAWDNIRLQFKHRTNREISMLSARTALLVEALRALGKERIDDAVIDHLNKSMSRADKDTLLREATNCSEWIYETVRKVCADT